MSEITALLSSMWDVLAKDEKAVGLPILANIVNTVAQTPTKAAFLGAATSGLLELSITMPGILGDEIGDVEAFIAKATTAALAAPSAAAAAPAAPATPAAPAAAAAAAPAAAPAVRATAAAPAHPPVGLGGRAVR
jgi:hypothetical protein